MKNLWAKLRHMEDIGILDSALTAGGNIIWLDGYAGNDACPGDFDAPVKTLAAAYALGRDGKHDVIMIKNAGVSAALCTVRLDAAFTWSKNCLHMVAQSPVRQLFSQRARIAPTGATTAFANFITMSGGDCHWHGIQIWHGFNTGTTSAIALTLTGHYNRFEYCHIAGMADAASAQNANSRCLKLGASENVFENCVLGIDTIARTAANSIIQFYANPTTGFGAARNYFKDCIFPAYTTTAQTQTDILVAGANAIDRMNIFERCKFTNSRVTSYLIQTAVASLVAGAGGDLLFKDCMLHGRTGFGKDADSRGQIFIEGGTPAAATTGLAVAPTA